MTQIEKKKLEWIRDENARLQSKPRKLRSYIFEVHPHQGFQKFMDDVMVAPEVVNFLLGIIDKLEAKPGQSV